MNLPIQYLRGIAAILVVFANFRFIPGLNGGAIGVDIFFILSGYIMSLTSAKYINDKLIFIKKRFIRVYPLYLFFLLIISFWNFYLIEYKLFIVSHTYIKVLYFTFPLLIIIPLSHLSHKFIEINFSNFLNKLILYKK